MSSRRVSFFDGFTSETTPTSIIATGPDGDITWQGAWVVGAYVPNQAVYYSVTGSTYVNILATTADQNPTDGTYWEIMAAGGGDVTGPTGATDNAIARYDSATGKAIQDSGVIIDDSDNITGVADITAVNVYTSGNIDKASAASLDIGSTNATTVNIGRSGQTAVIKGNLQVDGTTTTVNSTTLDVADANITINKGGNQVSADDISGITVEMSDATNASILYDKDATSKWKLGVVGSEVEIADISSAQTFTNKEYSLLLNTYSSNQTLAYGTDQIALASGASTTITLPSAISNTGKSFFIKKTDSTATGDITVACNGAETIDGSATYDITQEYEGIQVVSNGSVWFII